MSAAGVVAVAEPAFWAGFDRRYPETFVDYFRQISEFEPTRAAQYGIRHFCWVAVNPKEAENPELSRAVLAHMPEFFQKPTVLGVGETGLHKSTRNECEIFEAQVELALRFGQLLLVHTPHLDDKLYGTKEDPRDPQGFSARSRPGMDRPRGRAYHPRREGRRLLGWLYAVPHHQMFLQTGRGHDRALWLGTHTGQLVGRLGTERSRHAARLYF
jgi:hypothetical protein